VTYTPAKDYVGMDAFTYTVRDNDGAISNVATVDIGVIVNQTPWRNPSNPHDVNNDGFVSPIDALLIINDLNFRGPRRLPNPPIPPFVPPPYLDASGDNYVSPIDALLIINYLNGAGGEGEGEGVDPQTLSFAPAAEGQMVAAPALDGSFEPLNRSVTTQDRRVTSAAAVTADPDYGLTIGQADTARHLALREYLASVADEDVTEILAADVADSWDEYDVSEHVALMELLMGRKPRGN
jgi:hypothetical protein